MLGIMIRRLAAALSAAMVISACAHSGTTPATERSAQLSATSPQVSFFGSNLPWPEAIVKGPDGNVWFTEFYAEEVARITPSGTITQIPLTVGGSVEGITVGPDGNLWIRGRGSK